MSLTFLTPTGAVLAAGVIAPFAALAYVEYRARRARRALRLGEPTVRSRVPTVTALAAVPVLLGLALAQPVLRSEQTHHVRRDAEAFFVFDTSRSMLAARGPAAPTRLTRAARAALQIHAALPDVPAGVATMTDRVLPD